MDYPSNTHKSKEAAPRQAKKAVVQNAATVKKKNKFLELFVPADVVDVKTYVIDDVLVPTAKDLILNVVHIALYGSAQSAPLVNRGRGGNPSRTSYQKYYDDRDRYRQSRAGAVHTRYRLEEFDFVTKLDAEQVLASLQEELYRFDIVSVSDYYEFAGAEKFITPLDHKYGWDDLDRVSITRSGGRWVINLPSPQPID